MADYAGACAAIKQRFTDQWTATPFGFVNEAAPKSVDAAGNPTPWALLEIVSAGSHIEASGTIGNQIVIYDGLIKLHFFAPSGRGDGEAMALAVQAAEIFRNQIFYNGTAGFYVRSGFDRNGAPRIDGGDLTSIDGEWFTVTATIPFEYWHRA